MAGGGARRRRSRHASAVTRLRERVRGLAAGRSGRRGESRLYIVPLTTVQIMAITPRRAAPPATSPPVQEWEDER